MSEKFKGFNVKDECVAGAIKFMTGISYYKYNEKHMVYENYKKIK